MTTIPTLTTLRLVLRPMMAADWPAYLAFISSDRSLYMGGPYDVDAAWGMFGIDHAQWHFTGCGALMMTDRSSGACLGQIAINYGPLFPEWELGWFVYADSEGHGYAFEAAQALRGWARDVRQLSTLVSYISFDNARSIKLAERLGAKLDDTAPRQVVGDLVFRHFGEQIGRWSPA